MDVINKDDAVKSKTVDAQTSTVDAYLTTSRGDNMYQNHWVLNFDGCTQEQVLELASRSVIITMQGRFRRADLDVAQGMQNMDVDVTEELRRETGAAPTVSNVAKKAEKLSPDQLAELIAQLEARQAAENDDDATND